MLSFVVVSLHASIHLAGAVRIADQNQTSATVKKQQESRIKVTAS